MKMSYWQVLVMLVEVVEMVGMGTLLFQYGHQSGRRNRLDCLGPLEGTASFAQARANHHEDYPDLKRQYHGALSASPALSMILKICSNRSGHLLST
jgi:hypothetical protein